MLLLWTVSVENLTGYNNIVCEFALCTVNLRDQPIKWERLLKKILENICDALRDLVPFVQFKVTGLKSAFFLKVMLLDGYFLHF